MASLATMTIEGGVIQLSGNPIWVQAATTRINVSEQYLLLKLVCTSGQIDTDARILRIKGVEASFNIQSIVDIPFTPEFEMFEFDMGEIHSREGNLVLFTLTVGESYVLNDEYIEEWTVATQEIQILKGKLSKLERGMLQADSENFYSYYIQSGRFLSKMAGTESNIKTIIVNDILHPVKMWFSFYELETPPDNLRISATYSDGTGFYRFIPLGQISYTGLGEINCHQMVYNASDREKTIVEYRVGFFNEGWGVNTNIEVKVLNKYSENHHVLYFLNRYGVVETVNFYGETSEIASVEQEVYTLQEAITPSFKKSTIESQRKNFNEIFKINGFKTLDERRWIKDLLLSPYGLAWMRSASLPLLGEHSFGFAPVIIKPGTFEIDTTSSDLMNIEIEVQIAHID